MLPRCLTMALRDSAKVDRAVVPGSYRVDSGPAFHGASCRPAGRASQHTGGADVNIATPQRGMTLAALAAAVTLVLTPFVPPVVAAQPADPILDVEVDVDTVAVGSTVELTASVYLPDGSLMTGPSSNTQVRFYFAAGSANAPGGNGGGADLQCHTGLVGTCVVTYVAANAGSDVICATAAGPGDAPRRSMRRRWPTPTTRSSGLSPAGSRGLIRPPRRARIRPRPRARIRPPRRARIRHRRRARIRPHADAERGSDTHADAQRRSDPHAHAQRRSDPDADAQRRSGADAHAERRSDARRRHQAPMRRRLPRPRPAPIRPPRRGRIRPRRQAPLRRRLPRPRPAPTPTPTPSADPTPTPSADPTPTRAGTHPDPGGQCADGSHADPCADPEPGPVAQRQPVAQPG